MQSDTIAAISTAFGEAAISLLRISGPLAVKVADEVFRSRQTLADLPARVQHFGSVVSPDGAVVDSVLATVFRGPASYTGEDVVEISCHGGILVTRRLFELLLQSGARPAEAGEFTQRAFLNGKMDLTQAEAVMDLIHAQSELALKAATQQLEGHLGRASENLRAELIEVLAHVEAYIDFPDEDIDPDTGNAMLDRISTLGGRIGALLDTANHGRILRSGARTVICGEPNVGKSSLLNLLSGFDRAIVSPVAGTTRDTIEEVLHVHGLPFVLVDTAGLRDSEDNIEQSGMERTSREIHRADVVIEVVDGSQSKKEAKRVPGASSRPGHLLILNKGDLGIDPSWQEAGEGITLSCTTHEGVENLRAAMRDAVWQGAGTGNSQMVAINARHQACFQRAAQSLAAAGEALSGGEAPEFVAVHLREAMQSVGEVTGRVDVEEILGAIFSRFCIGK